MPSTPHHRIPVILATLVLATAALAGCLEGGPAPDAGASDARYASFQEAMDAPGASFEPADGPNNLRLKLLSPSDPHNLTTGSLEVVLLLYDADTGEPVTDADFSAENPSCTYQDAFCATMPAMGHGTSPETNPAHGAHGVYVGSTTISMPGGWLLHVNPMVGDEIVRFDVPVSTAGGMDMGDGAHEEQVPSYASFDEALAAPGPSFTANLTANGNDTGEDLHVKLLHPNTTENTTVGHAPIQLLLHTGQEGNGTPVTDAHVELASWMPMMGHGTHGEEAPTHQDHGVYLGATNHTMEGKWLVNLTIHLPSQGDQPMRMAHLSIPFHASGDGASGHEGHDM